MKTRNQARLISQQINIMAETMSTIINLSIESTEINDHLATCYPFEESLDDLLPSVKAWANAQAIHPEMDEDEHPVQVTKNLAIAVIQASIESALLKIGHEAAEWEVEQITVNTDGFPSAYDKHQGEVLSPLNDALFALVEWACNWCNLYEDANSLQSARFIADRSTINEFSGNKHEIDPAKYACLIVEYIQKQYQHDGEYGFSYDDYLSWFWDRVRNGDSLLDFMSDTFESFGFKDEDEAEIWHLICEQKEDMKHMR
jgi:hypothetical protein